MSQKITFLLFLSLIILFTDCKSKKIISDSTTVEKSRDKVLFQQSKKLFDFEQLTCRGKIDTESEYLKASGRFFLKWARDSFIWVQITKLGFEINRTLIRPDSFFIVDRFNKAYSVGKIEELADFTKVELNFDHLQSLLAGNFISQSEEMKMVPNEKYYSFEIENELWNETYFIDPQNFMVIFSNVIAGNVGNLTSNYTNYEKIKSKFFPLDRNHVFVDEEDTYELGIQISKYDFNSPINVDFNIPANYDEMKLY